MNNWTRTFSVILMVGGGLIIAVAIVADWIGLDSAGIGIKQVLLGLAGIVTLLAGLGILKSPEGTSPSGQIC